MPRKKLRYRPLQPAHPVLRRASEGTGTEDPWAAIRARAKARARCAELARREAAYMRKHGLTYPPLQSAHHSDRITVEQAVEAFRAVDREHRREERQLRRLEARETRRGGPLPGDR